MARVTSWSSANRPPGWVNANWGLGEDPDAVAVEVLFEDERGNSYVLHAVGPSPQTAVPAAEEEARRWLGCDSATDWRAA